LVTVTTTGLYGCCSASGDVRCVRLLLNKFSASQIIKKFDDHGRRVWSSSENIYDCYK